MSTFLELCQDYSRECNFSGLSTNPTSVVGQTGRLLSAVENIKQSWIDIQNRHANWRWMNVGWSFSTSASDDSYAYGDITDDLTAAPIDRFDSWDIQDPDNPPRIYLTTDGVGTERWLIWVPWHYFQRIYERGTQNDGPPSHIAVDPQNNIRLGPAPDGAYTVSGDYNRGPQVLLADGDTPDMPSQFHNLIWANAIELYGINHAAQHIILKSHRLTRSRMRQLEANQLPDLVIGEPMA